MMSRGIAAAAAVFAIALPGAAQAQGPPGQASTPGAAGVGDPYFPAEGNGGYDVRNHDLTLGYDPATDHLDGLVLITARATQTLGSFHLDLQGLDVHSVRVNDVEAQFTRDGQELIVTPHNRLHEHSTFTVAVDYGGSPATIVGSPIVFGSPYGFLHTDDGNFIGAEPNAASTWFPGNDHPSDKASYVFRVTVPEGKSVIANGRLVSQETAGGKSTFTWEALDPMATYLATVDTGNWVFKNGSTPGGVPATVAVDPTLIQSQPNAVDFFYDTSAEAGSATRSRWPTGTTSGSTRASRRSRSTCGWTTRARGPRSSRSMRTTRGRRPPRSGGSSWPTRSATRCSPRPCTAAAA